MSILKSYLSAYLPILLWSGFIFFLSSQKTLPGPDLYAWDFVFKKTAHVFVYFVLMLLTHRAVYKLHIKNVFWASLVAVMLSVVYAMTDEFHQSFVPGRSGTLRDLLYDMLGIGIAWLQIHKYV